MYLTSLINTFGACCGLTLKVLGYYCSCAIACYWYQMSHDHDGWLCVRNGSSHSCCERICKLKNGLASYDASRGSHCGVTGMMVTKGNHPQMAWLISAIFGLVWITMIQQSGVGCLKHFDSSNFNNSAIHLPIGGGGFPELPDYAMWGLVMMVQSLQTFPQTRLLVLCVLTFHNFSPAKDVYIYIYIILITYPIHIISYPYIHHLNQTCSIKQQKQQHYSNSTFLIHIMVVYIPII
jgi:hypothetical protein